MDRSREALQHSSGASVRQVEVYKTRPSDWASPVAACRPIFIEPSERRTKLFLTGNVSPKRFVGAVTRMIRSTESKLCWVARLQHWKSVILFVLDHQNYITAACNGE